MLIGIEIAQLQVGFGKHPSSAIDFFSKRLDRLEIRARVFRPLTLPQTHRVIVLGQCIAGL